MRILVIKIKSIGDVLLATPLIHNLKLNYPDAKIDVLINKNTKDMLSLNPDINEIYEYDREKIKKLPFFKMILEEFRLVKALRKNKYDIAIQTSETPRGIITAFFIGAKRILSYEPRKKYLSFLIDDIFKSDEEIHVIDRDLLALKILNAQIKDKKVRIYFENYDLKLPEKFVHFHPMSAMMFKACKADFMAKLIDFCELELKIKTVITCDKNEVEIQKMKEILSFCKSKPIVFEGNLNLKQVAYLSSKSSLYIGVDTSIMHIAAANDVPVIAFFGPSITKKWGPWDNSISKNAYKKNNSIQKMGKHTVIQKDWPCGGCNKRGCENKGVSLCLEEMIEDIQIVKKEIKNKIS